jgi:hypothetical protein
MPAAAAFSFLKQTRGLDSWGLSDLAKALKITFAAAKQILTLLELQGYVRRQGAEWTTTPQGEEVSGSTMPRLKRETVDRATKELAKQIKAVNEDPKADYRVTEAVAFGDFMNQTVRAQAADVGIRLQPRREANPRSAKGQQEEQAFLARLRGRSAMFNVKPYEDWMGRRSHVQLLD